MDPIPDILASASVRVPRHLANPKAQLIASIPRERDPDQRLLLLRGDATLRRWEWLAIPGEPAAADPDARLLAAVTWATQHMDVGPMVEGQPRFRLIRLPGDLITAALPRPVLPFHSWTVAKLIPWVLRVEHPWALGLRGSELVRAAHPAWSELTSQQRERYFQGMQQASA